jgi:hypothetical protein
MKNNVVAEHSPVSPTLGVTVVGGVQPGAAHLTYCHTALETSTHITFATAAAHVPAFRTLAHFVKNHVLQSTVLSLQLLEWLVRPVPPNQDKTYLSAIHDPHQVPKFLRAP